MEADGTLSCSYHGWRFAGSGACTRIPQALDGGAEAAACASPRSCVTSYPVAINVRACVTLRAFRGFSAV